MQFKLWVSEMVTGPPSEAGRTLRSCTAKGRAQVAAMSDGYSQTVVDSLREEAIRFGIGLPSAADAIEYGRPHAGGRAEAGKGLRYAVDNMAWRL
jgi:hypothetical protein